MTTLLWCTPAAAISGSAFDHVLVRLMTLFTCFDARGDLVARCQTEAEIEVLRMRGRCIAAVRPMATEDLVVCSIPVAPDAIDEEL